MAHVCVIYDRNQMSSVFAAVSLQLGLISQNAALKKKDILLLEKATMISPSQAEKIGSYYFLGLTPRTAHFSNWSLSAPYVTKAKVISYRDWTKVIIEKDHIPNANYVFSARSDGSTIGGTLYTTARACLSERVLMDLDLDYSPYCLYTAIENEFYRPNATIEARIRGVDNMERALRYLLTQDEEDLLFPVTKFMDALEVMTSYENKRRAALRVINQQSRQVSLETAKKEHYTFNISFESQDFWFVRAVLMSHRNALYRNYDLTATGLYVLTNSVYKGEIGDQSPIVLTE